LLLFTEEELLQMLKSDLEDVASKDWSDVFELMQKVEDIFDAVRYLRRNNLKK